MPERQKIKRVKRQLRRKKSPRADVRAGKLHKVPSKTRSKATVEALQAAKKTATRKRAT